MRLGVRYLPSADWNLGILQNYHLLVLTCDGKFGKDPICRQSLASILFDGAASWAAPSAAAVGHDAQRGLLEPRGVRGVRELEPRRRCGLAKKEFVRMQVSKREQILLC